MIGHMNSETRGFNGGVVKRPFKVIDQIGGERRTFLTQEDYEKHIDACRQHTARNQKARQNMDPLHF